MITQRELLALRAEWSLDVGVIEKDYLLGWLLAGIAIHDALSRTWVFKGGTCLRKCYYETFRFSEDLDLTIVDGGPEEPDELTRIFVEIAEWVREESGIELIVDDSSFRCRMNRRGRPTVEGRVAYRGPRGQSSLANVKLDAPGPPRTAALCGLEPAEGRHRLPGGTGTSWSSSSRALSAAAHTGRQPRPLRRQRPGRVAELSGGPDGWHPANGRSVFPRYRVEF